MKQLKENEGIERSLLLAMAVIAGLTVANCYYNQPLLEMIRHDIGVSQHEANLITVVTQIGYALGLCFLIPMGDLYSRRRIISEYDGGSRYGCRHSRSPQCMDDLGSLSAIGSLLCNSAVFHTYSRTIFREGEQKQEYGRRSVWAADRHTCIESG